MGSKLKIVIVGAGFGGTTLISNINRWKIRNNLELTLVEPAEAELLKKLSNKEKIMGFGHAIYRESDPRNDIKRNFLRDLLQIFRILKR